MNNSTQTDNTDQIPTEPKQSDVTEPKQPDVTEQKQIFVGMNQFNTVYMIEGQIKQNGQMVIVHGDWYADRIPGSYMNLQGNVKTKMNIKQGIEISQFHIKGFGEKYIIYGFYGDTMESVIEQFVAILE
jgi:hypothetical protein